MKRFLLLMILSAFEISNAVGQSQLNLPKDNPVEAQNHFVLMQDNFKQGNYHNAYSSLKWIVEHAPDMHETVYKIGQKTLKKLIESEPENQSYKDELMDIYDQRIHYYGNEIKVLSMKAFDAFKYFRSDPDRLAEVVDLFEYLNTMTGHNMADHLLLPYFELKLIQFKAHAIDENELIKAYQNIGSVIEHKRANSNTKMEKVRSLIDSRLVEAIDLDCDRIGKLFVEQSNEVDQQLDRVRLIIKLSLNYGCSDRNFFVDALKQLNEHDPTLKVSNLIASWYVEEKQYEEALVHFEASKRMTTDSIELSNIYLSIARVHSSLGEKTKARKAAKIALQYNPENLECYNLIGDLYFNSYEECKKGISRVVDRSIFFAAYEKYALAREKNKMAMAEQQFPSMEVIHQEDYMEGQVIESACWIGEKVKIRRRPNYASN